MHFWKKENQILMLISASLLQNKEEFNLKIQCSLPQGFLFPVIAVNVT